jgi:hypothetical protein
MPMVFSKYVNAIDEELINEEGVCQIPKLLPTYNGRAV